ncbi:multidrug effflux MFS transporter [Vibrio sp. S17_S38]|uniref:multidrug effflux MFS transporter n=1 Tax=Vibrio sp. S17_S38 TaxID=2720229 RepID=UPI001680B52A|nr:multidrug effflux MFS transporter [Vibrio sp. S17_S38]MBD1574300.1 multidrug effflux MFS transporter [Vibrio sp. S17_S38]
MSKSISASLIVLLASVFALSPFSIDTYLPAIPTIASDLNVEINWVAMTVSLYVFGLAIGQLLGGQFSDKYGRRIVMMIGLIIFALGSVAISSAQSIQVLWACRFIQSIGGGIAIVCVPALIRDNAEGREAARLFSLIALIMMIAPSIAPSVGTLILALLNWHFIFIFLGILGFILAVYAFFVVPKPVVKTSQNTPKLMSYSEVLRQRTVFGYLLALAFGFSVMLIFLTNSPFVYMEYYGVSEKVFSILFLMNVLGLITINRLNSYLLKKHGPAVLLVRFIQMQLCGAVILLLSVTLFPQHIYGVVAGFIIMVSANAGIMPNTNACYLQYFKHNSGKAAGLLGSMQFLTASIVSGLVAYFTQGNLWPVAIGVVLASAIALWGACDGKKRLNV